MSIAANLRAISTAIAASCRRAGRAPESVRLLAVSKTQPAEAVNAAAAAGQLLFGENYVQELLSKAEAVEMDVSWHFIGHLQSNKVKYLRGRIAMLHSLDRLSLARELDRQWARIKTPLDVLIQVNLGDEASKSGIAPAQTAQLAREVATLSHLRLRGLMGLPPYCENAEEGRAYFRHLRQLAGEIDALGLQGVSMSELSMGMSHDFEVAIEEGATLVRVGSAIFGERLP